MNELASDAQKHSFAELAEEVYFFTPALIPLKGQYDRGVMGEFIRCCNPKEDDTPFAIDCEWPLFDGLGQSIEDGRVVNWDHRLYGVRRGAETEINNFLLSIALVNRRMRNYGRVTSHILRLVDAVKLHTDPLLDEIPVFTLTVYGVSMMDCIHHMAPAKDPPRTRPYATTAKPDPEIIKEGRIALGIKESPDAS
jgi:hypothetical protein